MTIYELLDIKAALEKASNWAHNQKDLFQMTDAKKLVEKALQEQEPKGLDGAANEYANSHTAYIDVEGNAIAYRAFKAGAKWMAEQGESEEDILKGDEDGRPIIRLKYSLRHLSDKFKPGDKVIVQIRKA